MKKTYYLYFLLLLSVSVQAQTTSGIFDTLFAENFEDIGFNFILEEGTPTGHEDVWLNWDEDGFLQNCVDTGGTYGFYAPIFDVFPSGTNTVLASCSWTPAAPNGDCLDHQNRNWLITEPVFIEKANTKLQWKSASTLGPFWVDGYKVLVARDRNLPTDFTDTLFVAAATLTLPNANYSLDPADYIYSPGYVQANGFTNAYFQFTNFQGLDVLAGLLEPHEVDLSTYVGSQIYIAFLHDTYCNYEIQLDDISVLENVESAAVQPAQEISSVKIYPQPASVSCTLELDLSSSTNFQYQLLDARGASLQAAQFGKKPAGHYRIPLDLAQLPSGVYFLQIRTDTGLICKKVFK